MEHGHCLLINPAIGAQSQNQRISTVVNKSFPTSLGILAGCLMAVGIQPVRIRDEQIHPISDAELPGILAKLKKPRIVGLSVLTINSGRAYALSRKIKAIDPGVFIMMGGIHPTVLPEEVLNRSETDVVVRGEAERTICLLTDAVLSGASYEALPGLSFRRQDRIIHNPDAKLIEQLDEIPPFPYHLFENDLRAYPNFSGILGSRGCPYRCTFCSSRSISGIKYRYHSVGRIISEIKVLVEKYRQDSVHLMDDNIAVNRRHFFELCDALVAEGLHQKAFFHGSMRGDNATNEVLEKAKQANFKILYFGLETGNERLMRVVDKRETVAQVADAIRRAAGKGFSVGATLIFGLPTETRRERYEIMKWVDSLPLSSVRFNTLTPYPGTPVYEQEHPKGKILVKGQWENFGVQYMWESDDIPYVPDGNDRLELILDTMWANLTSYLTLRGIRRMLTQRYAGGNVIKLEKAWYLSFRETAKLFGAFSYLLSRFLHVALRVFWRRLRGKGSRPSGAPPEGGAEPAFEASGMLEDPCLK